MRERDLIDLAYLGTLGVGAPAFLWWMALQDPSPPDAIIAAALLTPLLMIAATSRLDN